MLLTWRRQHTQLYQQAHRVVLAPVLDDLAVCDSKDRHTGDAHLLTAGGNAHEIALMRADECEALDDFVALGDQIVGGGLAIGESHPRTLVNHLATLAPSRD